MKQHCPVLLVAICFLLTAVVPTHAAQIQLNSNAPYLCVAVNGGSTAPGTAIISYSCSGSFGQQWNYFNGQLLGLGTANGASMCLNVNGSIEASGALVDLEPCNGGANQQWWIIPSLTGPDAGTAVIMAFAGNGGCLDNSGGPAVGGGTQLVVNNCTLGASQQWILRRTEIELNTSAPHLCVADEAGNTANGTPVIAYSCSGAFNDEWNFNGGKITGIGTANGTTKCLTVATPVSPGNVVTLSTCTSSVAGQRWWALATSSTPFGEVMVYPGGLCLDSAGGPSVGGGTQLVVNECNGAASQNWNLR